VSLVGSLFAEVYGLADDKAVSMPQWSMSRRLYGWLSGVQGKEQGRVRSLHDVSDGGLLVAIAEGLVARNLGVSLRMPDGVFPEAWAFGEGFHRLVLSCSEADSAILESEWETLALPYRRLGTVTATGRMELQGHWSVPVMDLRKAWRAEEDWR
jgi:phosphoribosylformylglycinamidine synthase